ncbi:uncharacterized protein LOC113333556 [Papaver somniferum]|uniref:uncharacterized protein LOC113333556 n=1 Tax=Papaver somniferum TaxID=3469 RepID=UPI000E705C7D|nr:uncharacterized protein LOC113333556 [Papaver somniferum]
MDPLLSKIFDVGHVQKHPTQLENGLPIVLKQVTTQNVTVAASISGTESTPSGPIRTKNSSRRFKTAAMPNTSPIITRRTTNIVEQDALLYPPITKFGELPTIDLSTCSFNTQPVFNSFGSYNVSAENSPRNNGVCNNSPPNAASSSLDSSQLASQSGDGTSASLGGGSDSTTQVNQPLPYILIDTAHNTINHFPVNNINMIAWNLRGFGKKSANKELSLLCKNVNPDIIFLSETEMIKDMAARKLKNMGFPCTFNVPSVGRSSGLSLAWKKEVHLNIISSSLRGIYVTTTDIIHSKTCHIHFMYGEPNSSLRKAFWE